ncbi:hypothetical protein Q3G72_021202 [Acer saccharum]|nr:hypothetical protein Q3G72_021202 [Acer saccharum]
MSGRYHILGGINDHSLKHVYLNSLPAELQDKLQRKIDTSGRAIHDTTLGEIHMFTISALEKLCATQKVFSKMLKEGKRDETQCRRSSHQIKCKSTKMCTCKPIKKRHFHSFDMKKNKKFKYYRKKAKWAWNKSQKCFVCGKKGHYAKKCPNKKAKSAKLVHQLEQITDEVPSDADIESIFLEQEGVDQNTTFVLQDSDSVSSSDYFDSSESNTIQDSYQAAKIDSQTGPQVSIQILAEKYSKPLCFKTHILSPAPIILIPQNLIQFRTLIRQQRLTLKSVLKS